MDPADYRSYDALGLAALVASGDVEPGVLLDTALAVAEQTAPTVNALVRMFEPQAREALGAGLPGGPFRGVPFVVKDLWTRVRGLPTSNGSRLFADDVAGADSEIVRRYRRAGLVLFAKSNSPELGLSPSTEPALFGPTHNPWEPGHSAGGSSGGAAAAVAAGVLPMAHATDGGGSIRIPASCCGLFGLKPTRGRISAGPERGEGWGGMSAQHVVSRSVRDSAAALDATAGLLPGDPYDAPPAPPSYLAEVARDPASLRVGLCVDAPTGVAVDPQCRAAAEATARRCEQLGHHVTTVSWPFTPDELRQTSGVTPPHIATAVDARLAVLGRDLRPGDVEPFTAMLAERGRSTSAPAYVAAVTAMHRIGRAMARLFEEVDVVVTPTMARPPIPLGVLDTSDIPRFLDAVGPMATFTGIANVTGQPAMSVPLDESVDGLPVGSQCIGRFGDEATLFRLAGQLERAHPWFDRVPPSPGG